MHLSLKKGSTLLLTALALLTLPSCEKKDSVALSEEEAPTHYEHLKELEWLVGSWEDKDADATIETRFSWDKYKNFLTQYFTVYSEGEFILEGKQIIAWDPRTEKIRSWVFDSDGGFGEGTWKKVDTSWVVESVQTLSDGSEASSTNIYTPKSADSYIFESIDREVEGEIVPSIGPVTVIRKKEVAAHE